MKVKAVTLNPFAGTQNRTFNFEKGLNILLGPNEAGKSTMFQAVACGLFTSTNKTASRLLSEMGDFFPAGGGDVIRLDILLELADGSNVKVHKTWKKGNRQGRAGITLPDGTEITDEDEVQKKIEELLPVSAATMRTVLLSDQTGLQETLRSIANDQDIRNELGAALRKTVMETGGVSVDRFRKILDKKFDDYFKKWDRSQHYPENNKGINNPYKSGTGYVVEAFYERERTKIAYDEALDYEKRVDELNNEISGLTVSLHGKKKEQNELNPLKEGIRKRQEKESKISKIEYELKDIREINRKWPVYEHRLDNIDNEIGQIDKQIEQFEQERKIAEKQQEFKSLKDRVHKLEKLKKDFEEAKTGAEKTLKVTEEQITELRELKSDIDKLEAQVNAARLSVTIEAKSGISFDLKEAGKENTENIQIKTGEDKQMNIRGGFTMETDSLRLNIFSGEGNIESIVKKLEKQKAGFYKLLQEIPAENIREAESLAKKYNDKQNDLNQAYKLYRDELGKDDHEELKKKLEEASSQKEVRQYSDISDDLIRVRTRKAEIEKEKKDTSEKLTEWRERYGEHDKVAETMGQLMTEQATLKKDIENLPELPDEFESTEAFFKYLDELDRDVNELNEQLNEKKLEKAQEEVKAPETSSEELKIQTQQAEEKFERIKKEAETLARIRDKTTVLLESMDKSTYKGLEDSFLKWLSKITGERFSEIKMDQDMPEAFITNEQRVLTYRMLSHGTKGAVALAWRFALCDHMLEKNEAVIALDDPLVDMDPVRRERAVEAIREFAERHQVLIMTCHPEHAGEMQKSDGAKLIDV